MSSGSKGIKAFINSCANSGNHSFVLSNSTDGFLALSQSETLFQKEVSKNNDISINPMLFRKRNSS